ncbi:helix-turn-helix transcriptional regulator [Parvularcula sp. ZS-1/3]|uniref:Helix-turn-helix transcriptional regulator n=1 Tax=Parvularcula mediterranea TaxID=2732508 RepID=A0A7Y3W515_9PROT|nr:helix-turn-helix transcriptional regulator [Parvularcula mediterranea]NNU16149.1 helix-turn-helix transcriptional regulator [Parvularcula mediterranea]
MSETTILRGDLLDRLRGQLDEARELRDEARAFSKRQLLPGSTGLVLSQLPREVTLAEAAARVADAYNLLHGGLFNRVVHRGGTVILQTDDRTFPFSVTDEETVFSVMEETLLFTHGLLCLVTGRLARDGLVGIQIRRKRGQPSVPFQRLTRVTQGGAVYALRYDAAMAQEVAPRPAREDLTFEAVIRSQIDILRSIEGDAEQFSDIVMRTMREGVVSQAEVAMALDVSPATLRRRLAEEGTSFREVAADLMIERADALLATSLPLAEIGERLGFSDVRSFNRAYRAQTGVTPAAARRLTG